MNARRLPQDVKDGVVRLTLGKGVLLILPVDVFVDGLQRGKLERRTQRRTQHQQRQQARSEAQALAWLDTQEGA